jgi:hypothetical protein
MSKARALHYTRTNIWWYVLYPWGTTMIQTKEEETREAKIRAEIEELTRTIIQEDWLIENIQKKINRLPISRIKDLKWMVAERIEHEHKRKFLDTQRNDKINLLNTLH